MSKKACAYRYGGSEETQGVFPRFLGSPRQELPRAPPPAPKLLRQPLEFSKTYCNHQPGRRAAPRTNAPALLQFFSYRLGDLPMNPTDSQIRFSLPTFFERKYPRWVSKTCLCMQVGIRVPGHWPCAGARAHVCVNTRARAPLGLWSFPCLALGHLCMCSMNRHTCNFKSFANMQNMASENRVASEDLSQGSR